MQSDMNRHTETLRVIYQGAMRSVDAGAAVQREIRCFGSSLTIGDFDCDLQKIRRIVVIAVGKAATPMYKAAISALQCRLEVEAVVVSPFALQSNTHLTFCPAAHPTPDERSRRAAEKVLAKLHGADEKTVVLFLISGGASAMIELPLDPNISVADTAEFYRALVGSGLPIGEMNTVRKHFSAVKGGRLACAAKRAAAVCTLIISDVPSGSLDSVGSGPSMPDPATREDCRSTLKLLMERTSLPASIVSFFQGPLFAETPKAHDPVFERNYYAGILSSDDLAAAAKRAASAAGFHVILDNTCDEWDYRDAGKYLLDRARELRKNHPRFCLVSVGELSVPIAGPSGAGGRNQQFALWCAKELSKGPDQMAVLSAGSDGIDGHSPAAGAVADWTTCERARHLDLDAQRFLTAYDSHSLFAALGDTIVTGPTGINLKDLRIVMSIPELEPQRGTRA
jgi:hydroxypyruvate reductase